MNATGATEPLPGLASPNEAIPSFNLWSEPWIGVLRPDGVREEVGIAECLTRAHEFAALSDRSPLVVAGTQRLLAAVAQAIFDPQELADLADLLDAGRFDAAQIAAFGAQWAERFDLFSVDRPFLQTDDVPLTPAKGDKPKTVAYLYPDEPTESNINHFRHVYDDEQTFCPACAARGVVTIPAFANAEGRGYSPSINGIPPLYVLPAGDSFFVALALSIVVPAYQPPVRADVAKDEPAWAGTGRIVPGREMDAVGYLQSLTFPARRVRLYPRHLDGHCSRCGCESSILVSSMFYEMGQKRPDGAPFWRDPFVAYEGNKNNQPKAVRLQKGKAVWREYATLFLTNTRVDEGSLRATVLEQLPFLGQYVTTAPSHQFTFRVIGMRTHQAKVFEWVDAALDVPLALLTDPRGAILVRAATNHATDWAKDVLSIFTQAFRPSKTGKRIHYQPVRARMEATYWTSLAASFREFVLAVAEPARADEAEKVWVNTVLGAGRGAFEEAIDTVAGRGAELRRRVQALHNLTLRLAKRHKEWLQ